jgi:hypothetical protein
MAYPQVDIQNPVQLKPARGPVIASKFRILHVTESYAQKLVRVTVQILEADETPLDTFTDYAWYGDSYEAVVPFDDTGLTQRVGEMVDAYLARETAQSQPEPEVAA